jgi:hypothetical protein
MPRPWAALILIFAFAGAARADDVEQWRCAELTLTSAKTYASPYQEVDVSAEFHGPGGLVLRRDAFWDGDNVWKIRFAPTSVGDWTWETRANDESDTGLHGRRGTLHCVPYTGDLPIYRHGFLRVADDHRHLAYRDGTPFFWLSDTHWLWEAEHFDDSNKPGFPAQFRGMVDRRAAQGFTAYQVEFFRVWTGARRAPNPNGFHDNAGGKDGRVLNVANFRDNVDAKWKYLADHGLVVATTLGILANQVTPGTAPREARLARYVCARYGAYPALWLSYQECTGQYPPFPDEDAKKAFLDVVRAVGHAYRDADCYQHPRTAHSDAPLQTAFRGEDWLDFTFFQGGHEAHIGRRPYYEYYFDPQVTLPQIEGEANYEHLCEGPGIEPSRFVTTDSMREKAWQAMQCGCAGYSYGAGGVWNAAWAKDNSEMERVWGHTPWSEGIDLPGANQLKMLRDFYTALPWTKLLPRPQCDGLLTWQAALSANARPAVASDPRLDTVVTYFYRGQPFVATFHHLRHTAYAARWFNPREGSWTPLPEPAVAADGSWPCPPQPDAQDWVLLLQADQPAGADAAVLPSRFNSATPRPSPEAINPARRAKVTASSTDLVHKIYDAKNAIDGNTGEDDWRHWSNDPATDVPSADHPVWLRLDWDQPQTLRRVRFFTMADYETQDYTIQWLDGDTWRTFGDADVTGNTETFREHVSPTAVTTRALRFLGRRGSVAQPEIVRVVELEALTE